MGAGLRSQEETLRQHKEQGRELDSCAEPGSGMGEGASGSPGCCRVLGPGALPEPLPAAEALAAALGCEGLPGSGARARCPRLRLPHSCSRLQSHPLGCLGLMPPLQLAKRGCPAGCEQATHSPSGGGGSLRWESLQPGPSFVVQRSRLLPSLGPRYSLCEWCWVVPGGGETRVEVQAQALMPQAFLPLHRLIELHSPDSRNTLILRCKDTATAHAWFTAIHANIAALLPQVLAELNATLGTSNATGSSKEVKHVAWLAEQVRRPPAQPLPWSDAPSSTYQPWQWGCSGHRGAKAIPACLPRPARPWQYLLGLVVLGAAGDWAPCLWEILPACLTPDQCRCPCLPPGPPASAPRSTNPCPFLQARLDGGRQQWRPVLMAMTEKDLLLYDSMPWTRDAWASPCHSYPLLATRYGSSHGATAARVERGGEQ